MITTEFYIGIISVIFLALGIFVGVKLKNKKSAEKSTTEPVELPNNLELSSREMEVLKMIATGLSNQEIADQLFVTINTIKSHTNNIYTKLNVKRRTQAIETARKLKIIQ
jgi:ATP/maltotriose-dependent transcriptional regulator MalT